MTVLFEHLGPAFAFAADEGFEFRRRAADRSNARLFKPLHHGRIGIDAGDFPMQLVNNRPRRAGGRGKPDPGRALVDARKIGGNAQAWQVGHHRQRPVGVFRKRTVMAALDQRQARPSRVEREIDRAGEHRLADLDDPLKGTSWAWMPAVLANRIAPNRDVMVPAPIFILPGLALAFAISSAIDFGPSLARTTISDMFLVSSVIGVKSLIG